MRETARRTRPAAPFAYPARRAGTGKSRGAEQARERPPSSASTSALARRVYPSTAPRLMRHRPSAASASPRILAARMCRWWSDSASADTHFSSPRTRQPVRGQARMALDGVFPPEPRWSASVRSRSLNPRGARASRRPEVSTALSQACATPAGRRRPRRFTLTGNVDDAMGTLAPIRLTCFAPLTPRRAARR